MRLAGAIGSVVLCLATAAGAQLVPPSEPAAFPTAPAVDPEYESATVIALDPATPLLPEDPVGPIDPVGDEGPLPPPGKDVEPMPEAEAPVSDPFPVAPPVEAPVADPVVVAPVLPGPAPEPPQAVPVAPVPVPIMAEEPMPEAPATSAAAPAATWSPTDRPGPRHLEWLASWSVAEPEPEPSAPVAPPPPLVLASWTVDDEPIEEALAGSESVAATSLPSVAHPAAAPAPEPVLASSDYAPWVPSEPGSGDVAASSSVLVPVATAAVVTASLVPLVRWIVGPFLLSRIRREDLLRQATRARIHDFVVSNPGAHLSEIRRALGMSKGPTSYHLQVLVAAGIVVKVENPPYSSYFANGASEGVRAAARALRVPKARSLLAQVLDRPGLDVQELVDGSPMARSMVYYHLNRLADVGLVEFQGGVRNRSLLPTDLARHFAGTVGAEQVAVDLVAPQAARVLPA